MSGLTEFLLARIAEDEAAARAAAEHRVPTLGKSQPGATVAGIRRDRTRVGERWLARYDNVVSAEFDDGLRAVFALSGSLGMDLAQHIARWDPARVLAECEAKRHLIGVISAYDDIEGLCLLALPYTGHEAYRAEWKP